MGTLQPSFFRDSYNSYAASPMKPAKVLRREPVPLVPACRGVFGLAESSAISSIRYSARRPRKRQFIEPRRPASSCDNRGRQESTGYSLRAVVLDTAARPPVPWATMLSARSGTKA
mmetsp:Transcript_56484/g.123782  ORF Transcript_56484/g.123782 Transcript_56484/m.123782 type:complete len:116 (-) Transcript_56484:182-529(-)